MAKATKGKAGRPRVKNKVKMMSAYLTETEQAQIKRKYGNLTLAARKEVLPKCG